MSLPAKPAELMATLEAAGVRFGLREGWLVLDAPVGALTSEVRAAVSARKAEITRLVGAATSAIPPGPPTPHPTRPCYTCRSSRWWQRSDGGWVCGVCHPRPPLATDVRAERSRRSRTPVPLKG